MNKKWQIIIFGWSLFLLNQVIAEQTVILTFKSQTAKDPKKYYSIIDKPENTLALLSETQLGSTNGIGAVLNGQVSFSNTEGQLSFNRETIGDTLNILITSGLSPIIYHGNTVANWYISEPTTSKMYTATRILNSETEIYSWNIQETTIPADQLLAKDTIVIFGDYKNIIVPEGTFVTHADPHLVLPNIYVKPQFSFPGAYIKYLKHSRLYRHIKKMYKDAQTSVSSLIEG